MVQPTRDVCALGDLTTKFAVFPLISHPPSLLLSPHTLSLCFSFVIPRISPLLSSHSSSSSFFTSLCSFSTAENRLNGLHCSLGIGRWDWCVCMCEGRGGGCYSDVYAEGRRRRAKTAWHKRLKLRAHAS